MNLKKATIFLAWLGLAWLGLAWLGLAWLGLAWLGRSIIFSLWLVKSHFVNIPENSTSDAGAFAPCIRFCFYENR